MASQRDWSWAELSRYQLTNECPTWYKPVDVKPPKPKSDPKPEILTA